MIVTIVFMVLSLFYLSFVRSAEYADRRLEELHRALIYGEECEDGEGSKAK